MCNPGEPCEGQDKIEGKTVTLPAFGDILSVVSDDFERRAETLGLDKDAKAMAELEYMLGADSALRKVTGGHGISPVVFALVAEGYSVKQLLKRADDTKDGEAFGIVAVDKSMADKLRNLGVKFDEATEADFDKYHRLTPDAAPEERRFSSL